jgi:hypothetical protein
MKEKDLINLGFKRNNVSPKESGEPKTIYYYTYDFLGFCLITDCDNDIQNDVWSVYIFEYEHIKFTKLKQVIKFITLLKKAQ